MTLLDAPNDAFGQAWNMPCAPTRSPREILAMGAATLHRKLRIWAVPLWLMRPLGLVYRMAGEVADVGFTWDRPYLVDGGKFTRRFGFVATPFEVGMATTAYAFVGEGRRDRDASRHRSSFEGDVERRVERGGRANPPNGTAAYLYPNCESGLTAINPTRS